MGIRQTMPIGMSRKILNAFSIHVGGFSKRRCRITKTGFDAGVERRFLKDIQLVAVHTINRKLGDDLLIVCPDFSFLSREAEEEIDHYGKIVDG